MADDLVQFSPADLALTALHDVVVTLALVSGAMRGGQIHSEWAFRNAQLESVQHF